ncbi:radical SAM protein [Patescibacteria group bacterium]|nr:radical SAM protein [Patescibacteria group bacterium]
MKILTIQEAYKRKFKRQEAIKELEYHASGHCVHIGKLSPGCYSCFIPTLFRFNLLVGSKCNLNCSYCVDKLQKEPGKKYRIKNIAAILDNSRLPNYAPTAISFSGGGEPLLYLDVISEYMKSFRKIEKDTKKRPWYYLYTNGVLANSHMLLRLKDLGFDEIRFHLGASNFSKNVYRNLKKAARHFKTVTVETPSWRTHRKKLFEMLPIIEDIGIKHLNLGETEVTKYNYNKIAKIFPDGEIYQCHELHLYDGGLAYDIIEEVLKKRYSYSVLDCNCFVKNIQRSPAKWVLHQDVTGLCENITG